MVWLVLLALQALRVGRTEHLPYTLRPLCNAALEASYVRQAALADRIICVTNTGHTIFRMATVDATRYRTVHNGIRPLPPAHSGHVVRSDLHFLDERLILTVARLIE